MEEVLVEIWRRKWNRFWGSDGGRKIDEEGFCTNLRPKSKSTDQLESFLTQLGRELLSMVWETEMP